HGPYIQIIEEPKQRGFRFRYECEGPSHGGLPGASSEKNRRTYPTNYVGQARVEVQLVTHTDPPRVHAHSLVGRHCTESGTCVLDVGPNDLTAFSNLGILHVTKKGVVDVLTRRLREERRAEEASIQKEVKELSKSMDLNIVRLKFTAYLQDSNGGFTRALKPVVSNPIYDSSPNASNLKISRMDKTCGSVLGGDEIFLLCDKVQKDIEIRFYEEDDEGGWEAFGDFSPTDVHKQYAIVFKTPPYHSTEIQRSVTVFLQLRRKKAGDSSDPKQFTYIPQVQEVLRKKQKPLPHYESWRGGGRGGGAGGFGGGALLQYCRTGDTRALLAIQTHLCSVQDTNGDPLHLSIIHLQTGVTQQLIHTLLSSRQQRILNTTNHLQQTPLHLAVITRQPKVVEALLRAGADSTLPDKDGRSPLHLAALAGDSSLLRLLLSHMGERHSHLVNTPDYHLQPLHLAVRRDGERCLRLLIEGGAKINAPEQKSGNTALHLAVRENLFKVACTLITEQLKADTNACTFGGNTPLHLAASLGSPTLCSMLIAAADKNIQNDEPLSCSSSSDEEVDEGELTREELAERAASQPINTRKRRAGHTPLDLATCHKVRNLLQSGQSPTASRHSNKKIKANSSEAEGSGLNEDTLAQLVEVLSVSDVPWIKLAEKLGMMTLTHLYQDSPTPCHHLLQHYKLGGGAVDDLVKALQSLGLTEGIRLLRNAELQEDKHSTATVDSGFSSQPMEEEEQQPAANH
uniref:Nuclear factor of kappa light polypeptide gene enhancer in B-cells 2 (p49/p100) n=1 Tax=Oryzias latipes TaxID=8090 RepID=A0A3P9L527_ORYLA